MCSQPKAIARDVNGKSSAQRGRPGLSYWEILVLAATRLGCGCDYDQLQDLAENHRALRQVMGIGDWESDEKDQRRFDWRRIESNLTLLRPETIAEINQAIVEEGHRLEPKAAQTVRGDSFVVETNIHYPTDSSLIADGLRKVLGFASTLAGLYGLIGWRQHKHLCHKARQLVRKIDRIAARKGNGYQERMKEPYRELLEVAEKVLTRADTLRNTVRKYGTFTSAESLALDKELETFIQRTRQVCGLARVVRGKLLSLREEDYVMAARLDGESEVSIISRYMLPGFTSYMIVSLTLSIPGMILGETALSFLGIGLRPPTISWGVMLQEAQNLQTVAQTPWLLWPVAFVILAVLMFNFLGDGLRDAADPYVT